MRNMAQCNISCNGQNRREISCRAIAESRIELLSVVQCNTHFCNLFRNFYEVATHCKCVHMPLQTSCKLLYSVTTP